MRRRSQMSSLIADDGGEVWTQKIFEYTGDVQTLTLPAGRFQLWCKGAQGGSYDSTNKGGLGGLVVGVLTVTEPTDLFIYVGGQPTLSSISSVGAIEGGFNGGGAGCVRGSSTITVGMGGGGATDIRIGVDSLYARVVVAGGGGGSASNGDETTKKFGGGEYGGWDGASESLVYRADQTAPSSSGYFKAGTFGQGASAYTGYLTRYYGSGGGGGGWYGGFAYSTANTSSSTIRKYNSGGSGYVFTEDTAANYPSGCLLDSRYYLTNTASYAYVSGIGNGQVIITKY